MSEWIRTALDVILIACVGVGLVQAARLIKHLAGLQQGRLDMERFVQEFNAAVSRAENGIKTLRQTARDTGDDLEKLVEKASLVRDELQYITQSADQVADRLTQSATSTRGEAKPAAKQASAPQPQAAPPAAETVTPMQRKGEGPAPSSRAEKELLQALQKLS